MDWLLAANSFPVLNELGYDKPFYWADHRAWLDNLSVDQQQRFNKVISDRPELLDDSPLSSLFNLSIISDYFNDRGNRDIYNEIQARIVSLFAKWFNLNKDLFIKDKFYASWFFHWENNLCKLSHRFKDSDFVQIRAVEDNLCPKDCLRLNKKIYKINSELFVDLFNTHWIVPKYGCRCMVSVFGKNLAARKIDEGYQMMPESLPKLINEQSLDYGLLVYQLIDKPYDFGQSYCRLVERLPRDTSYYPKVEQLRLLEIFRESIDIIVATKSVETAQSRMDVAKSMLANFNWKYVTDAGVLEQIKDRVKELFMDAHTATYVNIHEAHLKKAGEVKRQTTKDKYNQLALDALEAGLKDEYTHKDEIQELLVNIRTKVEYKD